MDKSKKATKGATAKKNAPAKKDTVKKAATPKKAATKKVTATKKDAPKKTAQPKQSAPKKAAKAPSADKSKATGKKSPEMSPKTAARVAAAMARNKVGATNEAETKPAAKSAPKEAAPKRANPKTTKTKDILMEGRQRALRGQVQDATYTSFAELDNKNLKTGNRVIFEVNGEKYTYVVTDSTLSLLPELFTNDSQPDPLAIFKTNNIEAAKLARRCFSYESATNGGAFPTVKAGDLSNLTRLVLAAYLFNEGAKAVSVKMFNRHWKNIELDDVTPGAPELPLQDQASEAVEGQAITKTNI